MSRPRGIVALLTAAAQLAICASALAANPMTGAVPDSTVGGPAPSHVARARAHQADNGLTYNLGPVLQSNRTHLIFWQPSGSGLRFDSGYAALFARFLSDVAADSHRTTNVYSLTGQYTDDAGRAVYSSSYGGSLLDTDPLPANGCVLPPIGGPGWTVCLSNDQIRAEVEHVVAADALPTEDRDLYFLVLPNGFGACLGSGPQQCTLGGPANNGVCGWHWLSSDQAIRYAVIPYQAVAGHCHSSHPRPNASTADPALSTLSHEHVELITDPFLNAWHASNGSEVGDLCASAFGTYTGTGPQAYNQRINGHRYDLQQEWSNADGGCASREESLRVSIRLPRHFRKGRRKRLTGRAKDPDGRAVTFTWFFGDHTHARGRAVSHKFKRAGVYRLLLRVSDSEGNWTFWARTIRVKR
jgi:hypothetical protein